MSSIDANAPTGFSTGSSIDATTSIHRGSHDVAKLLADLAAVAPQAHPVQNQSVESKHENQLAVVRLGMATSLYSSLRAKHPPTASHSLRVALVCAAWCDRLNFGQEERDRLEVAAFLHDIGKIGIPDQILRKPGKLTLEEQLTVSLSPQLGCEILRGCCNDEELLEVILHAPSWFSGRRDQLKSGDAIPKGSRMLAVADAFDAMTTDHVYRPAMSREAAMSQLLNNSGTQFDPELVQDFCAMMQHEPELAHRHVLSRWLEFPAGQSADSRWAIQPNAGIDNESTLGKDQWRFHESLLGNMNDGVIYVDRNGTIQGWNYSLEKLTGIAPGAVLTSSWSPGLLGLSDDEGDVADAQCPVRRCLANASHVSGRYSIRRHDGITIPIRVHVAPVAAGQPGLCGVIFIAQDASQQRNLEERVEELHQQATQDPLTRVANRAAFDIRVEELVKRRVDSGSSFSLIICDIDHFKRVNDVHGHLAGDDALVSFATILSANSREGDLVSRYGGEEFVILSPDCDIATATRRAEIMRFAVESTPLPAIGNHPITASFGVTEVQAGDSPDSVLARADRALLQAKDKGRNRVIQLGIGGGDDTDLATTKRRRGLWSWFDSSADPTNMTVEIITPVPVNFAIEKLRGFIADHKAEIVSVSEGNLQIRQNVYFGPSGRRSVDSQISFSVRLMLTEKAFATGPDNRRVNQVQTLVKVEMMPTRSRDRRRQEVTSCAQQIIMSLKSYLMGRIETELV